MEIWVQMSTHQCGCAASHAPSPRVETGIIGSTTTKHTQQKSAQTTLYATWNATRGAFPESVEPSIHVM